MSLKDRIQDDMKAAMRAKDKRRLGVIRLILAAIKQREVDERIELSDAQALAVLEKMIKQRRESLAQYQSANRADLADQEAFEIELIQSYLPAPLNETDLDALIADAIAVTGAQSVRDMGKVMALIKDQAQGRVDMTTVSARVKARFGG
ncbi:MAG: GatB/YqeY domain-containing protein [Candidatus Competibacter sp.]|nr:GatB/YqeY domain-containing protein [Candidatus Competibacter sp.]MDG4605858.1 GatB/YqeY domain-containing protein [Candidatus Contendobacter sp.]HRD48554.1 GatB/YqeY domain-containing protein [Candidatus Contendobacter sp.]